MVDFIFVGVIGYRVVFVFRGMVKGYCVGENDLYEVGKLL